MPTKTKTKRQKSKAKARSSTKPLLRSDAYVRRSKNGVAASWATSAPMSGLVASYMTMPMRLAACRTPLELWRVQAGLAHQGLMLMQSLAFGRPIVAPQLP